MFCKKRALENPANFTGKYLCWSLFLINLQAWGPEACLKRDSSTCIFPAKFVKFLRAPSVKTICEPLFLYFQVILFTIHVKDTANEAYLESSQTYDEVFWWKQFTTSLYPANMCWSSRRLEDIFKTCLEDAFKTSSA